MRGSLQSSLLATAGSVGTPQFLKSLARLNRKLALIPRSPELLATLAELSANRQPAKGGSLK